MRHLGLAAVIVLVSLAICFAGQTWSRMGSHGCGGTLLWIYMGK